MVRNHPSSSTMSLSLEHINSSLKITDEFFTDEECEKFLLSCELDENEFGLLLTPNLLIQIGNQLKTFKENERKRNNLDKELVWQWKRLTACTISCIKNAGDDHGKYYKRVSFLPYNLIDTIILLF